MGLIPIGIVGFGYGDWTGHTKHIDELCKAVGNERSFVMLVDVLDDGKVDYDMYLSNPQTEIEILSHPGLVDATKTCFELLMNKLLEHGRAHQKNPDLPLTGVVVAVGCWSGQYRADVCRRALAEALNSVRYDGERVFNACDFSLHDCKSSDQKRSRVRMVEQWINEPWMQVKSVSKEDSWCEGVVEIGKHWSAHLNLVKMWSLEVYLTAD